MPELSCGKIAGVSSQKEHHKIAADLKVISDNWDKEEALTGVRPADAYEYGFGLVMEQEFIYSAPPDKMKDLIQKILDDRKAV